MLKYSKKLIRDILIHVFKPFEHALELFYQNHQVQTVWIIGPPRSGTTLLYNILCDSYSFSYISNFSARFTEIPLLAILYGNLIFEKKMQNNYDFNYGKSQGNLGPHEATNLWYRWFPAGEKIYVPKNSWDQNDLKDFKRVISAICNLGGSPGLFKNTYNSMRIAPILEAFPNALFLVVERNPVDISQSILKARMKFNKDKNKWWALPPNEIDEIKNHPYWEQVTEQVYYIYKQIESDKKNFNTKNFHYVSYKDLCLNTKDELKKIEDFFSERNLNILRNDKKINTKNISYSTGLKVNDKDYKRIKIKTKELWK